jgi:preprotein translocase SecE subunit
MKKFFKEIQKELKLTTFPSRNIVFAFTAFVLIFTAIMAVYFGVLDLGFGESIIKFITRFKA